MKLKKVISLLLVLSFVCSFGLVVPAAAATGSCGYNVGATTIFEGMATNDKDITIYNDKIAVSFAVGSNNYWNMTKGSILDIGIRGAGGTVGDMGVDLVNDVELLMDLWTSTGTYKGVDLREDVTVTPTLNTTKDQVSVTAKYRFWVADADKNGSDDAAQFGTEQAPLTITTVYTLKQGCNYITLNTTVTNPSTNKVTYKNMYSGYSISTLAASMFGPYGYYPDVKTTGIAVGSDSDVQEYFGDFVVTYGAGYAVSLQMDGTNSYKGSSGYKDVYKLQNLEPGKSYSFVGEVLVSGESETATIMNRYFARRGITDYSTVSGKVVDNSGAPVAGAYVIAEKTGVYKQTAKSAGYTSGHVDGTVVANMQPLVWDITDENGNYSISLPNTGFKDGTGNIEGNSDYTYQFKVEAAGYTSFMSGNTTLTADMAKDFNIEKGAQINLTAVNEKGDKIPFKVVISGITSEIKTLGGGVYYSNAIADDPYGISFNLSKADNVTFTASYGANYETLPVSYTTNVTDKGVTYKFVIKTMADAEAENWYAMDNHQHSDFGDGATSIEELYNSQIASALDMNVVSDHDARANNAAMANYAKADNREFLSSLEVSPGWGHWGILNVPYDATGKNTSSIVDATTATPQEITATAHKLGALVVLNHPYSDYGFLNNQMSVNGGTAAGWDSFDFLELQPTMSGSSGNNLSQLEALTASDWQKISLNNINTTLNNAGLSNIDAKSLATAMAFWNQGTKKYLSGGSDQHDATSTTLYPGIIRVYAQMDSCTVTNYLNAMSNGSTYVTMGPLMFPSSDSMFGSTKTVAYGDSTKLTLDVQAVNGCDKILLYSNGVVVDSKDLAGSATRTSVTFDVTPGANTKWYSFVAVDSTGLYAASNPVWVNVTGAPKDITANSWYEGYVNYAIQNELMNGTSATTFAPNATLSRAMVVTVLYRMAGSPAVTGTTAFTDVEAGKWYTDAVMWASQNNIVNGTTATTFTPNGNITRQQMAAMFYRYASTKGADVSGRADISAYTDAGTVSAYATDAVKWAVSAGLVNGRTSTTLVPAGNSTRAEFAAVIYRYQNAK